VTEQRQQRLETTSCRVQGLVLLRPRLLGWVGAWPRALSARVPGRRGPAPGRPFVATRLNEHTCSALSAAPLPDVLKVPTSTASPWIHS
jgi:hypothetical protein